MLCVSVFSGLYDVCGIYSTGVVCVGYPLVCRVWCLVFVLWFVWIVCCRARVYEVWLLCLCGLCGICVLFGVCGFCVFSSFCGCLMFLFVRNVLCVLVCDGCGSEVYAMFV